MKIEMLIRAKYSGANVSVGDTLTLDTATALQLINEGSAKQVESGVEADVVAGPNTTMQDGQTNDNGEPTREELEAAAIAADEEVTRIKKAVDNQYKKDELVEAAFKIGVEFPAEATKAVIIEAAVAQGKAEALLK